MQQEVAVSPPIGVSVRRDVAITYLLRRTDRGARLARALRQLGSEWRVDVVP